MQNIIINCYNDKNEYTEKIEYSKRRFMFASDTFRTYIDESIQIPAKKHSVELFLIFLDDYTIPNIDSINDIIELLNVAQYCQLPQSTVPGKNFLIDIIYEKIMNRYDISFNVLSKFINEIGLEWSDYNSCRVVLQNMNSLIFYNFAGHSANPNKWRKEHIQKIKNEIETS